MTDAIASGDPGPSTLAARRLPIPPKQSQADAEDLDEALVGMLGERVEKSLANFRVGHTDHEWGFLAHCRAEQATTSSQSSILCSSWSSSGLGCMIRYHRARPARSCRA